MSYFVKAAFTNTGMATVGRPISRLSSRPSSNKPPWAPVSQVASKEAIGSGRPAPISAAGEAYLEPATGQVLDLG
jgi:hypothetical protein